MIRNRCFTLIELLVVIAIFVIIASMVHPTLKSGIESAHLIQCSTNYRHLHVAFETYIHDHERYPFTISNQNQTDRGGLTWDDFLAMGYDGRDISINILRRWSVPANDLGTLDQQKAYQCPSAMEFRPETDRAHRTYSYNVNRYWGPRGGFSNYWDEGDRWSATMHEVYSPDGTFLLVGNIHGHLSGAGGAGYGNANNQSQDLAPHFGQYNYLFADGHAELFFSDQTGHNNGAWTRDPND